MNLSKYNFNFALGFDKELKPEIGEISFSLVSQANYDDEP